MKGKSRRYTAFKGGSVATGSASRVCSVEVLPGTVGLKQQGKVGLNGNFHRKKEEGIRNIPVPCLQVSLTANKGGTAKKLFVL
jgi:hypothetical protein